MGFWPVNSTCDEIGKSTDGQGTFPGVVESSVISAFVPDVYRPLDLYFEEKSRSPNNLFDTFTFESIPYSFESPKFNPDNQCYCETPVWDSTRRGNKLLNSTCYENSGSITVQNDETLGLPLTVGLPHFVMSNVDNVKGDFDRGNWEEYKSELGIEPISGTIVTADKKFQQGMSLVKDLDFKIYENMPFDTMSFPLVWVNESIVVPEYLEQEQADSIDLLEILEIVQIVSTVIGASGVVIFSFLLYKRFKSRK